MRGSKDGSGCSKEGCSKDGCSSPSVVDSQSVASSEGKSQYACACMHAMHACMHVCIHTACPLVGWQVSATLAEGEPVHPAIPHLPPYLLRSLMLAHARSYPICLLTSSARSCSPMLAHARSCSLMPAHARPCSLMLAHARSCSLMLAHARSCSPMLAHARSCSCCASLSLVLILSLPGGRRRGSSISLGESKVLRFQQPSSRASANPGELQTVLQMVDLDDDDERRRAMPPEPKPEPEPEPSQFDVNIASPRAAEDVPSDGKDVTGPTD